MNFTSLDYSPVFLTLKLATTTVMVLLFFGVPISWWLAHTRSRFRPIIEAVVALPLVLPPTVLGFYLLILLGPHGWIGRPVAALTGTSLSFSFIGLVFASTLYSMKSPLEAAWTLGASRWDAFCTIATPLALRGYITAIVLGFAHTLGEFGVVLMVGGSIPGKTKVVSIEIYDHVETLEYTQAHILSGGLLLFSFLVLLIVYSVNRRLPVHVS